MTGTLEVLVLSGDRGTSDEVGLILRELGAVIHTAGSAGEAESVAERHALGAVVVDDRGGDEDPLTLLTHVRRHTPAPVIMLTNGDSNRAGMCLEIGADDCLPWPASARELKARVKARTSNGANGHGRLEIDTARREVVIDGRTIELADREFDLLSFMAASPGVAFSADQLLSAIWDSTREWQSISTIREHIYRLRNKIEKNPAAPELIVTVRGHGYRFEV